jgi:hypothetical protein
MIGDAVWNMGAFSGLIVPYQHLAIPIDFHKIGAGPLSIWAHQNSTRLARHRCVWLDQIPQNLRRGIAAARRERFCPRGWPRSMLRQWRGPGRSDQTNNATRANKQHSAEGALLALRSASWYSWRSPTKAEKTMATQAAYARELRQLKETIKRKLQAAAMERTHEKMRRRDAVKAKLRAQGLKVSHYSAKEISLMVEAAQNLQVMHRPSAAAAQAQVLCESHAQNGAAR